MGNGEQPSQGSITITLSYTFWLDPGKIWWLEGSPVTLTFAKGDNCDRGRHRPVDCQSLAKSGPGPGQRYEVPTYLQLVLRY